MKDAAKLKEISDRAADLRAHDTDPNVVAYRVEQIRGWVDRLIWSGMILGLLFTMANVQHFASTDTKTPWTTDAWKDGSAIEWIVAWLLDPMVSLIVIGVLMGEQVINRHDITAGGWVRVTKWVALGCTYTMNTWQAWSVLDPAKILLHSVPPAIVVCAAEAGPTLRRQITQAVEKAYETAHDQARQRLDDQARGRAPMGPESAPAMGPDVVQAHEEMGPKTVPDAAPGPFENGPQAHIETVPRMAPGPRGDGPGDGPQAHEEMGPVRPKRRAQARPKVATKGVTEDQWTERIRQTIADHPGINPKPSAVLSAMGIPEADRSKISTSGVFKRAMSAVRAEADGADRRLRAVNE